MNDLQKSIFEVIISILSVPNIHEYAKNSAVRYGILNYIAKYSLAKDDYYITDFAYEFLNSKGFIVENKLRRGCKSKKNGFTYEHPVPCNHIGDLLISNRKNHDAIKRILDATDKVTILTQEENSVLSQKYSRKMPSGWKLFEDTVFSRYLSSGIVLSEPIKKLQVYGALCR